MASNSKQGYEKQREYTRRILEASKGIKDIVHRDSKGRAITSADDVKEGPDGGIDLETEISGKNNQALSRKRNLFNNRLRKLDAE